MTRFAWKVWLCAFAVWLTVLFVAATAHATETPCEKWIEPATWIWAWDHDEYFGETYWVRFMEYCPLIERYIYRYRQVSYREWLEADCGGGADEEGG